MQKKGMEQEGLVTVSYTHLDSRVDFAVAESTFLLSGKRSLWKQERSAGIRRRR